jgi:hypothetical protein
MPESERLEQEFFTGNHLDTHQPNTLSKRGGKRIQDIHSRGDPSCEFVIVLRLVEDLFLEDGEDSLRRIAGLKARKERMRGQVILGLKFVGFQRSVENGHKVGM